MAAAEPRKSPILQSIQQWAGHPNATSKAPTSQPFHFPGSQTGISPVGLRALHERKQTSAERSTKGASAAQLLTTIAVTLSIAAASKAAAQSPGVRARIQKRWAQVENVAASGTRQSQHVGSAAGRKAREHWPRTKRILRRFGPIAAGILLAAMLSRTHHQGERRVRERYDQDGWPNYPGRLIQRAKDVQSDPGAMRRVTAFFVAAAACAVAQVSVQRRSSIGISDNMAGFRRRLPRTVDTWSRRMSATLRSKHLHWGAVAGIAWQSARQPLSEGKSRKMLLLGTALAFATEAELRHGTDRTWRAHRLQGRMRAARDEAGRGCRAAQRKTRTSASKARQRMQEVNWKEWRQSRNGRIAQGALVLAAAAVLGTQVPRAFTGGKDADTSVLATAQRSANDAAQQLQGAMQSAASYVSTKATEAHGFVAPRVSEAGRPISTKAQEAGNAAAPKARELGGHAQRAGKDIRAKAQSALPEREGDVVTGPVHIAHAGVHKPANITGTRALARPSLLLLAVAACDLSLREKGYLYHVAPQQRQRALQQLQAQSERLPRPILLTGAHVRHAAAALWQRLSTLLAYVPAHLRQASFADLGYHIGVLMCNVLKLQLCADLPEGKAGSSSAPADIQSGASSSDPIRSDSRRLSINTGRSINGKESTNGITSQHGGSAADVDSHSPDANITVSKKQGGKQARNASSGKCSAADGSRVIEPEQAADMHGGNPLWMVRELVTAGVLAEDALQSGDVDVQALQKAHAKRVQPTLEALQQSVDALPSSAEKLSIEHFQLEEGFHHLNHGSYGGTLQVAAEAAQRWRAHLDASPCRFLEEDVLPELAQAVAAAARFVGADPHDCVPAANTTAGVTTLLRSLDLSPSSALLTLSSAYSSITTAAARAAAAAGAAVVEVQVDSAALTNCSVLMERLRGALDANSGKVGTVVVDHVLSFPPVVLPVRDIAELCHEHGAKVIVDGAHAIGNLTLDIPSLNADAYVTNCHKWLCTPRGAALVWVAPPLQATVTPLVASHGAGLGFQAEHLWAGTADWSAWLAVRTALGVVERVGLAEMQAAQRGVLQRGAAAVLQAVRSEYTQAQRSSIAVMSGSLGSSAARRVPSLTCGAAQDSKQLERAVAMQEMPFMAAIRLPALPGYSADNDAAQRLRLHLRHERSVEAPVIAWEGALWVRVSAAPYNTAADYEALAEALSSLLSESSQQSGKASTKEAAREASADALAGKQAPAQQQAGNAAQSHTSASAPEATTPTDTAAPATSAMPSKDAKSAKKAPEQTEEQPGTPSAAQPDTAAPATSATPSKDAKGNEQAPEQAEEQPSTPSAAQPDTPRTQDAGDSDCDGADAPFDSHKHAASSAAADAASSAAADADTEEPQAPMTPSKKKRNRRKKSKAKKAADTAERAADTEQGGGAAADTHNGEHYDEDEEDTVDGTHGGGARSPTVSVKMMASDSGVSVNILSPQS